MLDISFDGVMTKAAGLVGALVSWRFLAGSVAQKLTLLLGGAFFAYYAYGYVATKTGLPEGLAGFFVGFFGMAVLSKAYEWVSNAPLGDWLSQAVKSVWGKWFPDKGA